MSACLLLSAASCTRGSDPGTKASANPMLRIRVTVPDPKAVPTRGLSETLETVRDLNVVVYFDEMNPQVFYYDASSDNGMPLEAGSEMTIDIIDLDVGSVDRISVYLLANYGGRLSAPDIAVPDDLKGMKLTLPGNNIPDNCVMFADAGTLVPAEAADNDNRMYLEAELERTLAKVTLSVEGKSALKEGLRITPTYFRVINVPREMWLAEDLPAGRENKAAATNIAYGYEMPLEIGIVTRNMSVGDHDSPAFALYLFENKQGKKETNEGERGKEATGDFQYASYIEVIANYSYSYYDDNNSPAQAVGDIIYRFCLGGDVDMDYNVMRNHHYKVTLALDSWGGAKEGGMVDDDDRIIVGMSDPDVNWRVDLDLSDWGYTGNNNIGGSAYYGSFGLSTDSTIKIFHVEWIPSYWTKWAGVRKNHSNGTWQDIVAESNASTSQGSFQFYVKPWRLSAGYPEAGLPQFREVTVYLEPANGAGMWDEFTIRQWTPVKIDDNLYMERFEYSVMLLAPWWTSGAVPSLPAGNETGWENTLTLAAGNSPAAKVALRKAGIYWGTIDGIAVEEIPRSSYDNMTAPRNAAFYLPGRSELELMLDFKGDVTDPYNTYLPLNRNEDYWTSTMNESGEVCYWDGTDHIFRYTSDLSVLMSPKRVRAAYRPSLDSAVDALSGLPRK